MFQTVAGGLGHTRSRSRKPQTTIKSRVGLAAALLGRFHSLVVGLDAECSL